MHHDDLVFPSGQPQGFSTLSMTQWDGNPEPIVRELLQNCLDAAAEDDRQEAEVNFAIRRVQLAQVPGIESYRKHFEEAVAERERDVGQGGAEKRVIDRIRRILDDGTTRVLFCRDNGVGLNPDRMKRLLTEGNTDKGKGGAGAFGIGHLTAFAGSDLRYVLYGGRCDDGDGEVKEVASGHAILASRPRRDGGGRGGHGYWLRGEEPTLFDPSPYPDQAPLLLRRELDRLDGTGTVVCIAGFNDFRVDDDPIQAIARVAAKNFLVAIWQGKMTVRVRDDNGNELVVSGDTLGEILERDKDKKLGEQAGGWLPGAQAHQAWEALGYGVPFRLKAGAQARIRSLESTKRRPRSQVQLFRNGMWITNKAGELESWRFKSCKPFSAVVMVEDGELARLVRDAEGPEHRGLDRRRLSKNDNKTLLKFLREIADELRAQAGEEDAADEFTPEGFAMLGGAAERDAEKVSSYKPRPGTSRETATVMERSETSEESVDGPKRRGPKKGRRRKPGAAPRQGRSAPGRLSAVACKKRGGGGISTGCVSSGSLATDCFRRATPWVSGSGSLRGPTRPAISLSVPIGSPFGRCASVLTFGKAGPTATRLRCPPTLASSPSSWTRSSPTPTPSRWTSSAGAATRPPLRTRHLEPSPSPHPLGGRVAPRLAGRRV